MSTVKYLFLSISLNRLKNLFFFKNKYCLCSKCDGNILGLMVGCCSIPMRFSGKNIQIIHTWYGMLWPAYSWPYVKYWICCSTAVFIWNNSNLTQYCTDQQLISDAKLKAEMRSSCILVDICEVHVSRTCTELNINVCYFCCSLKKQP